MTVPELKKALKAKGLSVGGVKQDLIERLQLAMASDEVRGQPSFFYLSNNHSIIFLLLCESSMPSKLKGFTPAIFCSGLLCQAVNRQFLVRSTYCF